LPRIQATSFVKIHFHTQELSCFRVNSLKLFYRADEFSPSAFDSLIRQTASAGITNPCESTTKPASARDRDMHHTMMLPTIECPQTGIILYRLVFDIFFVDIFYQRL
jgi:hypothetical protein